LTLSFTITSLFNNIREVLKKNFQIFYKKLAIELTIFSILLHFAGYNLKCLSTLLLKLICYIFPGEDSNGQEIQGAQFDRISENIF